MIIGNGLLANSIKEIDTDNVLFFASGVSNSLETRKDAFLREENLLVNHTLNQKNKFIYFSTCSIYDPSKKTSPYVLHKLNMEEIIRKNCTNYLILRVGNAVGKGGNDNTLINYLIQRIQHNEEITIHSKAERYLIDVDDIKNILVEFTKQNISNQTINIAYPERFNMEEILVELELFLSKKGTYKYIDEGNAYAVDMSLVKPYFNSLSKAAYLQKILKNTNSTHSINQHTP